MNSTTVKNKPESTAVLIIGGGIAGLVMAVLLERKGYNPTLIEQSKAWKPVGGGITLTLNGVGMLRQLGLLDSIQNYGNPIRHINFADQKANILSSFNLDSYAETYGRTLTIMRHDLHGALISQLKKTKILLGVGFVSLTSEGEKTEVVLSNGLTSQYDLVIGADGINSSLRGMLFPQAQKKYSGYACWRFVVNDVQWKDWSTVTEMWGKGKRFGMVPLLQNKVHCFASINAEKNSLSNLNISLDEFRNLYSEFKGDVPHILKGIKHKDDLIYNDLDDIYIPQWHQGRIVLIGDAAHGMTPNMAQGASMAIEDAHILSELLSTNDTIKLSLYKFYKARIRKVSAVQRKSYLLGIVGQFENPVLCHMRNFLWKQIPDRWIQSDLKQLLTQNMEIG